MADPGSEYLSLPGEHPAPKLSVMTYNILAQALAQRERFPHSAEHVLSYKERKKVLSDVFKRLNADILCLQEVDHYTFLEQALKKLGYDIEYVQKPDSKHGCAIAYKRDRFRRLRYRVVQFNLLSDAYPEGAPERAELRRNNVAQLIAVALLNGDGSGNEVPLIVTNTHLYWNSRYGFVRLAQAHHLLRSVVEFNEGHWPVLVCGDFNTKPYQLLYRLLTAPLGDRSVRLSPEDSASFQTPVDAARVGAEDEREEDEEEGTPAVVAPAPPNTGARSETVAGLLSSLAGMPPLASTYLAYESLVPADVYSQAMDDGVFSKWRGEPPFTAFSSRPASTIDYIFTMARAAEPAESEGAPDPLLFVSSRTGGGLAAADGMQLEGYISFLAPSWSKARIKKVIKAGAVSVAGSECSDRTRVLVPGEHVTFQLRDSDAGPAVRVELVYPNSTAADFPTDAECSERLAAATALEKGRAARAGPAFHLVPVAILRIPTRRELMVEGGIPSSKVPSDHLPLVAQFAVVQKS